MWKIKHKSNLKKTLMFLFIMAFPFLVYWRLFFSKNPNEGLMIHYYGELQRQYMPYLYFWQNAIKNGDFPLWNPYILSGYPFLASFTIPRYNFFNLFYLVFTNDYFYNFIICQAYSIFFVGLGGFFIYLLCLHLNIGKLPSLAAVIIYEINYATFHLPNMDRYLTYPFFPLIFLILLKLFSTQNLKYSIFLGVVLALCFFGTHKMYFYFLILSLAFLVIGLKLIYSNNSQKKSKKINCLLLYSLVFFIGLISIELLPQFEFLLFYSAKPEVPQSISESLGRFHHIFSETKDIFDNYLKPKHNIIGISAIILATISLYGKSRNMKTLLMSFSFFIFIVANSNLFFINEIFYLIIPGFDKIRLWARIAHFQMIGLALLTAYGLNNVEIFREEKIPGLKYFIKYLLCLIIICFIGSYLYSINKGNFLELQSLFYFSAILTLGLIFIRINNIFPNRFIVIFLLLIVAAEQIASNNNIRLDTKSLSPLQSFFEYGDVGFPIDNKIRNFTPKPLDYRNKEDIYALGIVAGHDLSENLFRNEFSVYGYMVRWLDSYYRFLKAANMPYQNPKNHDAWWTLGSPDKKLISLLSYSNAKDLSKRYSSEVWPKYEPKYKIPKIKIFKNAINASDEREAEKLIHSIDVSETVIFENAETIDSLMENQKVVHSYEPVVELLSFSNNKIKIKVNNPYQNGFLFYSDNYYQGWKVYIDGIKNSVYRANITFKGVIIPLGEHVVEFKFLPISFIIGFAISVITLLGMSILFFNCMTTKQKVPISPPLEMI